MQTIERIATGIMFICICLIACICISTRVGTFNADAEYDKIPQQYKVEAMDEWKVVRIPCSEIKKIFLQGKGNEMLPFHKATGVTTWTDKVIYLSDNNVEAKKAFYHELGHVLDYSLNWASGTHEFHEIYVSEAKGYGTVSPKEFFAETYKSIVIGNAKKDSKAVIYILRLLNLR